MRWENGWRRASGNKKDRKKPWRKSGAFSFFMDERFGICVLYGSLCCLGIFALERLVLQHFDVLAYTGN